MAEQDSSKALIPPSATTDTFSRRRVITTAATGAALMALGAVAVRPPAKLKLSAAASPSTKRPVFKNVVLPVTFVLLPNSSKW